MGNENEKPKPRFDFKEFVCVAAILILLVYICLLCGFEELSNYWKAIISTAVGLLASAAIQIFDPLK